MIVLNHKIINDSNTEYISTVSQIIVKMSQLCDMSHSGYGVQPNLPETVPVNKDQCRLSFSTPSLISLRIASSNFGKTNAITFELTCLSAG
jgi:hypothetical protein